MNNEIDKVLRNLGVIAALKQNDKLQTEGEFFAVYVPTVMRGLVRMLYGEAREMNMQRVTECIHKAKNYVSTTLAEHGNDSDQEHISVQMKLLRHNQIQHCTRVLHALSEINTGLDNLVETYRDDAAMVCRIRNLKDEVNDFVESTQFVAKTSPVIRRLVD